jgi:CheY-like chemotaxis protein
MSSILIVDDEPMVIRVVKLGLERAGHEVTSASNGAEALKLLRDHPYDVLITDLNMPRMDGRELCQAFQQEMPERDTQIFVVTARPGEGHRSWAGDLENVEFVEKPASVRRLIARIAERTAAKAASAPEPT